jgi:hypothetical protein
MPTHTTLVQERRELTVFIYITHIVPEENQHIIHTGSLYRPFSCGVANVRRNTIVPSGQRNLEDEDGSNGNRRDQTQTTPTMVQLVPTQTMLSQRQYVVGATRKKENPTLLQNTKKLNKTETVRD